jgi:hypothetical protein
MGNPRKDTSFYLVTVSILYSNLKIHALQGKIKLFATEKRRKSRLYGWEEVRERALLSMNEVFSAPKKLKEELESAMNGLNIRSMKIPVAKPRMPQTMPE